MFDVTWTDPGVEKVGERKARKEKEHDLQARQDALSSKRGSTSTRRSSSSADKSTMTRSTGDKASSLFGSFSLKKKRLSSKSKTSHASDLRIPIPEASTVTPSLPTASTFCSTFSSTDFLGQDPSQSKGNLDAKYLPEPIDTTWGQSEGFQTLSTQESRLPQPTQSIAQSFAYPPGKLSAALSGEPRSKLDQDFGPDSWITKTTETLVDVTPETGAGCTRSEIMSPLVRVPAGPRTPAHRAFHCDSVVTNSRANSTYGPPRLAPADLLLPSRPNGTMRSRKSPASSISRPPKGLIRFRAHDTSRWKAPEEWDIEDLCTKVKGFNLEEQFSAVERPSNDSLADLASVQREIKKMSLLVPASILFRLEEKLADSPNPSAYKETEMERKRLMLFALGVLGAPCENRTRTKASKILALFETEATASYLAAIHPESSITHLSPSPLSALLFPNIRPLVSPIMANSVRSVATSRFTAVYSLLLPSLLSSHEITVVLRGIHTSLLPGGTLHLVLINPVPATCSLGPRMRQWMEDNLLLNLERQFRCTNPRRLIPMWLGDVGLRANDSTKITVKFQAVVQKSANKDDKDPKDSKANGEKDGIDNLNGGQEELNRDQQAKVELQSRLGRQLWQENWGSYVHAKNWWWDDPTCVEECVNLGTYWEYSIVEAVKGS